MRLIAITASALAVTATSFKVTLHAGTHHPAVNTRWPYSVRVVDAKGHPLRPRISVAVVDPIGGELFEASIGRLKPLGQLVAIGFAAGMWPEVQPASLVGRNVGLYGFYLGRLLRLEPELVGTAVGELLGLWQRGSLRPLVGAELPLDEVERAHELVESRKSVGKVVLVP